MFEGYMVDPDKPWCAAFARSEPNFSVKVTFVMRMLMFEVMMFVPCGGGYKIMAVQT